MPNYTQFKQGPVIPSQTKKKKFTGLLLLRGSVCNYLLPLPLTTTHRELNAHGLIKTLLDSIIRAILIL